MRNRFLSRTANEQMDGDNIHRDLTNFRKDNEHRLYPHTPYKVRVRGYAIQLYSEPQLGVVKEHALESDLKWLDRMLTEVLNP